MLFRSFALQQNNLLNDINWGVIPLDLRQTDITQSTEKDKDKDKERNRDRNKKKEMEKGAANVEIRKTDNNEEEMERGRERGREMNSKKLSCFYSENSVSNNEEVRRLTKERMYLQAR